MRWCFIIFLCMCITLFLSCDSGTFSIKNSRQANTDSVMDYSTVDVSPYFEVCDSLTTVEKEDCFRTTLHASVAETLGGVSFFVTKDIEETVLVYLQINAKGRIKLKKIEASDLLVEEIPELKEVLQKAIHELPRIHPAYKNNLPVTSEYVLPITVFVQGKT